MDIVTLVSFLFAAILLTLAPGPDILFLLAVSIANGTKSGVSLAGGLSSGVLFHTTLVIIGVAALLQSSPVARTVMRYVGACYLLYLAYGAFKSEAVINADGTTEMPKLPPFALYRRGLLMNILNPKVLLFFLAFLPQFVDYQKGNVSLQIATLGATFAIQAFCIFSLVACGAASLRRWLPQHPKIIASMGKVQAVVLVLIAALLVFI